MGVEMGAAYAAIAVGFLIGLWMALSPEAHWHRHYGKMIKDARPTAEGLAMIRRSGITLTAFCVLSAAFLAWFQVRSERRTRETVERITRPPGSTLDRSGDALRRP